MSQSGSQAWAFYRQVAASRLIRTVRDNNGFPAPKNGYGKRAMPFWSSLSRVEKVVREVPAYEGFAPVEIPWDDFRTKWAPGLVRDGLLVGVNWSGERATGFDVDPASVVRSVETMMEAPQ